LGDLKRKQVVLEATSNPNDGDEAKNKKNKKKR